ncbi:MAG: tetratricopeptide repeat protein [Defluviitaleaceae bacterium]|nr:tetratricopeptide repeat protein [Defluviitaleaceae bacterium]
MRQQIAYDQEELRRLCIRLQLQKKGAFFCVTIDNIPLHRTIANEIQKQLPSNEVQIIDFQQMHNTRYSAWLIATSIKKGTKYAILPHFHLANDNALDTKFFQTLNLSRDALADMPVVFVFIMPMYFRTQLARHAPDFNSFFQYSAIFETEQQASFIPERDIEQPYSESNKHLLDYYVERLGKITDTLSKEYFETLANILTLNNSVRTLRNVMQKGFYIDFCNLLPIYENDSDIKPRDVANIFDSQGNYTMALEWYLKSLGNYEKTLSAEHPNVATSYNDIARVYNTQGDHSKALEWFSKSLAIYEKILGTEHTHTATAYNNIAYVYDDQRDYPNALEWYFKSLDVKEKILGSEHPDTASTYNNIATIYQRQGNYPKALEWYLKSSSIWETALGTEHPDTSTAYNNIAGVYRDQGDYSKALEWYLKSLDIDEKILGTEHPDTAITYSNIANVYYIKKDYTKALDLLLKCYKIRLNIFGKTHHHTTKTKLQLETIYQTFALPQSFEVWLEENLKT